MAGLMGTTGAAMVLIHPLLRANAHRSRQVHLVVFFILLVANAGGATTPLGDPPLYIGFLRGVPFQWPLLNLFEPLLWVALPLLVAFYLIDRRHGAAGPAGARRQASAADRLGQCRPGRLRGAGRARAGAAAAAHGRPVRPDDRDRAAGRHRRLPGCRLVSLRVTPAGVREANEFSWHPIEEVAILFAAIFITIAPVGTALSAGFEGPMAPLLQATLDAHGNPEPWAYFWLTGILSGFLDNAPTYLVFFELAEIEPDQAGRPEQHRADRHFGRCGVLRGADLYRQCAEHDGARDRRAARREDAGVLSLRV